MVCRHTLDLSGSIPSRLYSTNCNLHLVHYLIQYNRFQSSVLIQYQYTSIWILQLDTYTIHRVIDSTSYTLNTSVPAGQVYLFLSLYCKSLHSMLIRSFLKKLITEIHYYTIISPLLYLVTTNFLHYPSDAPVLFSINALFFPSISLCVILIKYLFY